MSRGKDEWPEEGDLVVGTISRVLPYGAYVTLDEFEKREGLIHISEISSTWIRNIRDYAREGQKIVVKVLRVDPSKGHVDLSLRRVTGREKKEKMVAWKKTKRADGLIKLASEKLGITSEEAFNRFGSKIEEHFGGLYEGFEEILEKGDMPLTKLGILGEDSKVLVEIAQTKLKIPKVKIKGIIELQCQGPEGVNAIKDILMKAENTKRAKETDIDIYVIGAPRYRVEITAKNYRDAEKTLQNLTENASTSIENAGGSCTFKRE
jgi:translation initiation factor 2 subunit 1